MSRSVRLAAWALSAMAVSGLAGCKSSTSATPTPTAGPAVFHVQEGFSPNSAKEPCLLHQTDAPTSAFVGGASSDPKRELPFLAYYRANGKKAFCDGKPSTAVDKQWAQLYVQLTNNPADVAGITGG